MGNASFNVRPSLFFGKRAADCGLWSAILDVLPCLR